ncbi:MAG: NTP transferase domain-containing protein [bacterium]
MLSTLSVSAVLLAAGTSSRMGEANKLLLRIGEKSVVRLSCENILKSAVDDLIVVVGAQNDLVRKELSSLNLSVCLNPEYLQGMSTSIVAGVNAVRAETDGALILLADQPNLKAATLNRFVQAFQNGEKKIIAGQYKNRIGNPALFHRSFFEELKQLQGDVGARSLLQRHPGEIQTIEISGDEILDLDTPQDFEALKAAFTR